MKTTLTFILSFIFISAFAQIPNNGFENWTNQGTYSTPDGWGCMNSLTSAFSIYTCEKGSPGATGSYYLKLTSKTVSVMGVVSAIAFTGSIDASMNEHFGFASTARPASLNGKWQYMAFGTDQGYIMAALTKWNATTLTRDTIAILAHPLSGMEMNWANFTLPFTYNNGNTPDSAMVMLSASGATPTALSYLYIDNLSFAGSVGIQEDFSTEKFILSPDPAREKLTITYNARETARVTVSIYDLNGKLVNEFYPGYATAGENREVISLFGLKAGTYLLKLQVGDKITQNKFIIQ